MIRIIDGLKYDTDKMEPVILALVADARIIFRTSRRYSYELL